MSDYDVRPFEMMAEGPDSDPTSNHGVLWAINKYLFHPRGFALAFDYDEHGALTGWTVLGDGSEPWQFPDDMDDQGFKAFEATLADFAAKNAKGAEL